MVGRGAWKWTDRLTDPERQSGCEMLVERREVGPCRTVMERERMEERWRRRERGRQAGKQRESLREKHREIYPETERDRKRKRKRNGGGGGGKL